MDENDKILIDIKESLKALNVPVDLSEVKEFTDDFYTVKRIVECLSKIFFILASHHFSQDKTAFSSLLVMEGLGEEDVSALAEFADRASRLRQ